MTPFEKGAHYSFESIEIFYNSYRPARFIEGLRPNEYEKMKSKEKVA